MKEKSVKHLYDIQGQILDKSNNIELQCAVHGIFTYFYAKSNLIAIDNFELILDIGVTKFVYISHKKLYYSHFLLDKEIQFLLFLRKMKKQLKSMMLYDMKLETFMVLLFKQKSQLQILY